MFRGGKLEHHPIVSGKRAIRLIPGVIPIAVPVVVPGGIFVAVGANLPGPDAAPPIATCRAAVAALDALPGLRLRGLSRWYRTAPMPPSGQPDYINGVAHLTGATRPRHC